jgi:uncharacterized phiE125 gp8 family phage protein
MLRPVLVTAPAVPAVSLEEAKTQLQVTSSGDDALITALVVATTAHLDGRAGILGRCLVNQTWRIDLACWPAREIRLPFPDVSSVTVTYSDTADVEQTLGASNYQLLEDARGSLVRWRAAFAAPALNSDRDDAVRVTLVAGYGAAGSNVPAPIRQAILLSVQQLWSMRATGNLFLRAEEVEGIGRQEFMLTDQAGRAVTRAVDALVAPYRRIGL